MKNTSLLYLLLVWILMFNACKPGGPGGILSRKTLREKYQDKIAKDYPGYKASAWMIAAEKNLLFPQRVSLPYAETGIDLRDTTDATGLRFQLKAGQQIEIGWQKYKAEQRSYFAELWQINNDSSRKLVHEADTANNKIYYLTETGGDFVFRFQPVLGASGRYSLLLNSSPFFAYPITKNLKSNIGSFWGADRDAGARRHEGVDIFAKKGSPVLAVANGYITRVANGGLGGKHIFLGTDSMDVNVYYAHLDSQLVRQGQNVRRGDVIGLVGNTGNAESTSPHLHFGIYTRNGAVDPLSFIKETKLLSMPPIDTNLNVSQLLRGNGKPIFESPDKNAVLLPMVNSNNFYILARHQQYYRVLLSDGRKGFVEMRNFQENERNRKGR